MTESARWRPAVKRRLTRTEITSPTGEMIYHHWSKTVNAASPVGVDGLTVLVVTICATFIARRALRRMIIRVVTTYQAVNMLRRTRNTKCLQSNGYQGLLYMHIASKPTIS